MRRFTRKRPTSLGLKWRRSPKLRRLRIYKGRREIVAANLKAGSPWSGLLTYRLSIRGRGRPMLSKPQNRAWTRRRGARRGGGR